MARTVTEPTATSRYAPTVSTEPPGRGRKGKASLARACGRPGCTLPAATDHGTLHDMTADQLVDAIVRLTHTIHTESHDQDRPLVLRDYRAQRQLARTELVRRTEYDA